MIGRTWLDGIAIIPDSCVRRIRLKGSGDSRFTYHDGCILDIDRPPDRRVEKCNPMPNALCLMPQTPQLAQLHSTDKSEDRTLPAIRNLPCGVAPSGYISIVGRSTMAANSPDWATLLPLWERRMQRMLPVLQQPDAWANMEWILCSSIMCLVDVTLVRVDRRDKESFCCPCTPGRKKCLNMSIQMRQSPRQCRGCIML